MFAVIRVRKFNTKNVTQKIKRHMVQMHQPPFDIYCISKINHICVTQVVF